LSNLGNAFKTGNNDRKVWNLTTLIVSGMGTLIILSLTAIGSLMYLQNSSIKEKIDVGDKLIHERMDKGFAEARANFEGLSKKFDSYNESFVKLQNEFVRIDTLQKIRIEREKLEEEIKLKRKK